MVDQAKATSAAVPTTGRPSHGGVRPSDLRALGLRPEEVLDFSASVSPIGPPASVWDALEMVDLGAYPDPQCLELREALSQALAVGVDRILAGNGSTELIHLLARANLSPPRPGATNTALILTPTYGEYEGACNLQGAAVSNLAADQANDFLWDLTEAARRIAAQRPSLVFLCNPNNPTGVFLQSGEVQVLAEATSRTGALLVVDEAYMSFVDQPWDSLPLLEAGNVVLLRSLTKDYALTSLRLGYSLASEEVTQQMAALQPDWSVNGLAQAAGLAALADSGYLPRAREAVARAKAFLTEQLAALGFTVHPSAANFLLVRVGDAPSWRDKLMRRGLFVRDCTSFGLPECVRLGIRSLPDCRRLVETMTSLLGEMGPPHGVP
jgi:histidinol-phosphate aminotransferase